MTEECTICRSEISFNNFVIFECNTNHKSCRDCFNKMANNNIIKCPYCRATQKTNNLILLNWRFDQSMDTEKEEFYKQLNARRIKLF